MTKLKKGLDYGHISRISIFRVVEEGVSFKLGREIIKEGLEVKKSIELSKKALFNLFDENTKKQLIKLEKEVNKAYTKLIVKTPSILLDRNTIMIGLDHSFNLVLPERNNENVKVYKYKRVGAEFTLAERTIDYTSATTKEDNMMLEYELSIQKLAKLLYAQEEFLKYAIETCLIDTKTRDIAIETALYVGYIDGYMEEQGKKLIK